MKNSIFIYYKPFGDEAAIYALCLWKQTRLYMAGHVWMLDIELDNELFKMSDDENDVSSTCT